MALKLYTYYRSSAAYRVRIALNLKGIAHELCPVNLLTSEQRSNDYLQINPQGFLPALETESGETLTQSTAILEWLETQYTQQPLLPAEAINAARVRGFCNVAACDVHPLNNLRVLKYLQGELGLDDQQKTDWYQHWIHEAFRVLESQLNPSDTYCFGDNPTLADVYLVPQVYNALRFNTDISAYPKISARYEHCNSLQAFIDAHPDNQPDAV